MGRQQRHWNRGRIGRGMVLSLVLHAQVLVPLVAWVFWWGAPEDNEIGLSFEDIKDDELPPNLPRVDSPDQPVEPAEPKKVASVVPKPETPEKPSKPLPDQPPKPEERKPMALAPVVPPEPAPKPVPPPEAPRGQKIVDLDLGKEVEAPEDAKYLAQKNNRAEKESRARITNLERNQPGKASEPSDDKDRIAQLEEREAKEGRRPRTTTFEPEQPRSTLSMRVPGVEKTPGEKLPDDPDGIFSRAEEGRRAVEGRREAPHLSQRGYTSAFGDDADLAAALAQQRKSKHKGRFTERKEKVLSALENFISEVTPGNQTELNTRAAPFAQFIAAMHRRIHEKWAFGFLTDMDLDFRESPMNDLSLLAKLEIVVNGEGEVDKIAMVRTSGNTGFDAAAIGSVYAAAPFPTPPQAILSGNGKVYLHWKFHRNGDACGTYGVTYFILDNGKKVGEKKPEPARQGQPGGGRPARG